MASILPASMIERALVVAIYGRVSSDEQREKHSIDTQREFCLNFCRTANIPVYDVYLDDGVSGTVDFENRPDGARLMRDAEAGAFRRVIVYKLDRLARNPRHTLNLVHRFDELGVDVKSVTEPFEVETPSGRFLLTMLAGAAGLERENTLERSRDATNRLARDGVWMGGIVPYGYRVDGSDRMAKLVPSDLKLPDLDLSEADVIRMIYDFSAREHLSCMQIADRLTDLRVPPSYTKDGRQLTTEKTGKRKEATAGIWRPSRVRNMLVNTTYKGLHVYGKRAKKIRETISRTVPSIVDESTWEGAQQTLRDKRALSPHNAKRQNLLRGLIRCGLCGLTYCGVSYPAYKGGTKGYYCCNGKQAARGIYGLTGQRCPSKAINATEIEGAIWADIEVFLHNPGDVLALLVEQQRAGQRSESEILGSIATKDQEITAKVDERNLILDLYRRRRIGETDLDRQLEAIGDEERTLKRALAGYRRLLKGAEDDARQAAAAADLLRRLRERLAEPLTWEIRREVVEALVGSVRVETVNVDGKKEARITVRYNFTLAEECTDARADIWGTVCAPAPARPRSSRATSAGCPAH